MVLKLQVIKPKVKLKKNKITMRKGEKARIKIKKKLSSDQVKKYRVDHKKVVRVTGNGKITGRKKGRTYVMVIMKSGVRKRCRIIVR